MGDVCCKSECDIPSQCSYTQSGCEGSYGAAHDCVWDSDSEKCTVGDSDFARPLILAAPSPDACCNFYQTGGGGPAPAGCAFQNRTCRVLH